MNSDLKDSRGGGAPLVAAAAATANEGPVDMDDYIEDDFAWNEGPNDMDDYNVGGEKGLRIDEDQGEELVDSTRGDDDNNKGAPSYDYPLNYVTPMPNTSVIVSRNKAVPGEEEGPHIGGEKGLRIDEDEDIGLPDDVFSMVFVSNWMSSSFWYGMFVFAFQMMILFLVLVDLLDDDKGKEDKNKLNVPGTTDTTIVVAQACALLIAVLNQDDIMLTITLVSVGFSTEFKEKTFVALQAKYPGGATQAQYFLANCLRLVEGLSVVVVSFVFIVQADNVLDIFLNFAAIEFVSELDNLGYALAAAGWVGDRISSVAKKVEDDTLPWNKKKQRWAHNLNLVLLVSLLTALYAGWLMVHQGQRTGSFIKGDACLKLQINFGDEVYYLPDTVKFNSTVSTVNDTLFTSLTGSSRFIAPDFDVSSPPDLHFSYFSGKYDADFDNRAGVGGVRPVYYENSTVLNDRTDPALGMFYYCEKDERWVFTIRAFLDAGAVPPETITKGNCDHGWLMRSPITQATVLDDVPTDGWKIWTGILDDASDFSIECAECKDDLDCGVNRGECIGGECKCKHDFIGDFCNRDKACDWLWVFDDEGLPYIAPGSSYGLSYFRLEGYTAYGRPVYVIQESGDEYAGTARYEVILYTGRRWYDNTNITLDDLSTLLKNDLHAYWSNLLLENTKWFTETTPSFLPTGPIKWYWISESQDAGNYGPFGRKSEFNQRFECSAVDCGRTRICGAKGFCMPNEAVLEFDDGSILEGGVCNCTSGFGGHFCDFEIADSTNTTTDA